MPFFTPCLHCQVLELITTHIPDLSPQEIALALGGAIGDLANVYTLETDRRVIACDMLVNFTQGLCSRAKLSTLNDNAPIDTIN